MSDVVNNSNIDCLIQGNTSYITLTFGSGDIMSYCPEGSQYT